MSPETYSFFVVTLVWLIVLIVALSFTLVGFYFLIKAYQHNPNEVNKFLLNILTGIVGGLIVAILLELKGQNNKFMYLTISGLVICVIGVFSFLTVKLFAKKTNEKDKSQKTVKATRPKTEKVVDTPNKGFWNKFTYFISEVLGVKKRFLIWVIIFGIAIFFVQSLANHNIDKKLDSLGFKPDVEAEISPFLYKASFGDYFPLKITNTGDYTFKDIQLFVATCEMLDKNSNWSYQPYELPLLPAHSETMIPLGDIRTINAFNKFKCYPFLKDKSDSSLAFNTNMSVGQNVTKTFTSCGKCYFNVKLFAKYGENKTFQKDITSEFSFPVDTTITISNGAK